VTGDIQARDGKVKEIGGDGKTHFLKAEIPLRKISVTRQASAASAKALRFTA
jgi:hypothetical protein